MRIGVLASGKLGFEIVRQLVSHYTVCSVMTDSSSLDISEYCNGHEIPVFIGNPRNGRAADFIKQSEIDVLISVNYLFIVENDILKWPLKIAFNIHGSLLPKYRGRTPHVWAIINNEKETGITDHLMEEGLDSGDILEKEVISISEKATGADILKKFEESYYPLIERILGRIESGTLVFTKQNEKEATYFGRRSPEDGLIDWNWQKERIQNWVRAQAYPYPGAFTFAESDRIVIDEVVFSKLGYSSDMPNGLILSEHPFIVKTPNGAIEVVRVRTAPLKIIKGTVLNIEL